MIEEYIKHKFNEMMTSPWTDMDAYKHGIIDNTGSIMKPRMSLESVEEKRAYPSRFNTICWNIRRLIESDADMGELVVQVAHLREFCEDEIAPEVIDNLVREELERHGKSIGEGHAYKGIPAGTYMIRGRRVTIESTLMPCDEFCGYPIYRHDGLVFVLEDVTKEDAPVNAVGHGNIAGVSPGQEPPGKRGLYFFRNKKKTKEMKKRLGGL